MCIRDRHDDLTGLQCGFIAIDKNGNYGGYSVYNGFNFAVKTIEGANLEDAPFDRSW